MTKQSPPIISLDRFRSTVDGEPVRVFGGRRRGALVAEAIAREIGGRTSPVIIDVPDDVYYISRSFRRALEHGLPNATLRGAPVESGHSSEHNEEPTRTHL
jgi:hypothetical protein